MSSNPLIFTQSKWDSVVDWNIAGAKGVKATIIRVGSIDDATGIPYEDYQFVNHTLNAMANHKPVGFYWYLRPKYSGIVQANAFIGYLRKVFPNLGNFPWFVDVEEAGVSPEQAAEEVFNFIQTVVTFLLHNPGIYTRTLFWDTNIADTHAWELFELHIARYNEVISGPWADGKYKPRDWNEWKIWQFTESYKAIDWGYNPSAHNPYNPNGYSLQAEMNYFNGTEAELVEYFGNQYAPASLTLEQVVTRLIVAEGRIDALEQDKTSLARVLDEYLHPQTPPSTGGGAPT